MKAFRKFYRNYPALISAGFIALLLFLSFFGHGIAPDNTPNANSQNISIRLKPPLFSCRVVYPHSTQANTSIFNFLTGYSQRNFIAIDSFYKLGDSLYYRKIGTTFWQIEPYSMEEDVRIFQFLLGTDGLGRDVLSRLIVGTRVSLLVGIVSVLISLIIGVTAGMLAGYYGGWIDKMILWLVQIFWAIPTVLLAMAILMGFRENNTMQLIAVFVAVGLTMWVETARLIRGLFMQLKEKQFIEAAKAMSFSDFRIIARHILPNTFSTLWVITASNFASAILIESGLSYLGLGVQPPTPSWGSMLREYYSFLGSEVSYLALLPGGCIMLSVLAFYMVGNGLRDALDVKR